MKKSSFQKYVHLVSFCLMILSQGLYSQIILLQGTVTDNGAEYLGNGEEPVENALVTLIDQANPTQTFSDYTDAQGYYEINITGIDYPHDQKPNTYHLLQNYPNPFNPSTVITCEIPKPSNIRIHIYNILGKKIKTLFDGFQKELTGRFVWNATDDRGNGVSAGVYIYTLKSDGIMMCRKMLLLDGNHSQSGLSASQRSSTGLYGLNPQTLQQYTFRVTGDDIETYEEQNLTITGNTVHDVTVNRTVTDIDSNVYSTVKIGNQWWMAENLKVTHYRNGDAIPNVTDSTEWANLSTGAYCNYNNDTSFVANYGRLYNGYAINDSRDIAPEGWHVPADSEWKELEMYLGMSQSGADSSGWRGTDEGGKLKETGTIYWYYPNVGATNESGFSGLPGGFRYYDSGTFLYIRKRTYFWSSTQNSSTSAWCRSLINQESKIYGWGNVFSGGLSVRLVQD